MAPVPRTIVRTSHALSIKAAGVTVGMINGWNPQQSRGMAPIFEVDIVGSGNPKEIMPGNITNQVVSVSRYDTYPVRMEQVFGTTDLTMLTNQSEPFDVIERWRIVTFDVIEPNIGDLEISNVQKNKEFYIYSGCWFNSLGRTLRSDDNRIVNVDASLNYTRKLNASGPLGRALNFNLTF